MDAMVAPRLAVQGATFVALGVLLYGLHRRFRRPYLLSWAWSSLCAGAALGCAAAAPAWRAAELMVLPAHALRLTWLGLGIEDRLRESAWLASRRRAAILLGVALLGLVATLTSIEDPGGPSALLRSGQLAGGLLVAALGIRLLRRRSSVSEPGDLLLGGALVLQGLLALAAFPADAVSGAALGTSLESSLVGSALAWLASLGMIACLLDDEVRASRDGRVAAVAGFSDPVTGLPSRELALDRLRMAVAQARRDGRKVAVLVLDLDRFETLNARHGRETGDALLAAVALRIRERVREGDSVSRLGPDEFVVLAPGLNHVSDAVQVARKVIGAVRTPFRIGDQDLSVTASIGVSLFPEDGRDAESVVRIAEAALRRAKQSGADSFQIVVRSQFSA